MCARKRKDRNAKAQRTSGSTSSKNAPVPKPVVGILRIPLDFNPTKTTTRFSKTGMGWLLQSRYFLGLLPQSDGGKERLESMLEAISDQARAVLENSALLKNLNFDEVADAERINEILDQNRDTKEWWSVGAWVMSDVAREALEKNDIRLAMWAVSVMHAHYSMLIYKQSIEESMWRGYVTAEMQCVLEIWEKNKVETNEEFWQKTLTDNVLILSQLFAFPVVILKEKAYLGGKGFDNAGGKLVDFLIRNQLSQNTALVEIKTPRTQLLETREYRAGVFSASNQLSGAVIQALSYKDRLSVEYLSIQHNSTETFHAFNPQCLVIAGNYGEELKTKQQRRSFELYRTSLKDVQVVTYDEMFVKLESLFKHLGV
jgi:Domain of unknown function (DUF4263)